jgi:hypothetical protein
MPVKKQIDGFKISVLDRMQQNLLQVQKLQNELLKIVKLNKQLSGLAKKDATSILNTIDPALVELQNAFFDFIQKNQQRDDGSLLEIHHGIDSLLYIQANAILSFCINDSIIDKQKIVKTAVELKKTSRTIIVLESLLTQRKVKNFNKVDFSTFRVHLNEKITALQQKEKTINSISHIIQNVSPEGQLSEEFKALVKYIEQGGSIDNIETKFEIEKIELNSNHKAYTVAANIAKVTHPIVTENRDKKQPGQSDSEHIIENLIVKENSLLFQLQLFIQTFKLWINTPLSIGWQQAKLQAIDKIKQRHSSD